MAKGGNPIYNNTKELIPGGEKVIQLHEQYLVDEAGARKAVLVPIEEWKRILDNLEELEDIRAYDEAKCQPSEPIPFEQAVREIHRGD
ncbi:MAG: hypothetical protein AB1641_22320 [Thermodesulfobacteriota bacterium]